MGIAARCVLGASMVPNRGPVAGATPGQKQYTSEYDCCTTSAHTRIVCAVERVLRGHSRTLAQARVVPLWVDEAAAVIDVRAELVGDSPEVSLRVAEAEPVIPS